MWGGALQSGREEGRILQYTGALFQHLLVHHMFLNLVPQSCFSYPNLCTPSFRGIYSQGEDLRIKAIILLSHFQLFSVRVSNNQSLIMFMNQILCNGLHQSISPPLWVYTKQIFDTQSYSRGVQILNTTDTNASESFWHTKGGSSYQVNVNLTRNSFVALVTCYFLFVMSILSFAV